MEQYLRQGLVSDSKVLDIRSVDVSISIKIISRPPISCRHKMLNISRSPMEKFSTPLSLSLL
jgi:hypothetical protein